MNFEDLGRVWREEPTGELRRKRIEDLSTVRGRADRFLSPLHRRGKWVGVVTLLTVVPGFTWFVFIAPRPWLATPGVTIVGTMLVVMLLRWRTLRPPAPDSTLPVCQAVRAEVARLRFLERFWGRGNVALGMGSLAVGDVLVFEGLRPLEADRGVVSVVFYSVLIVALAFGILRNPLVARLKVRPLREDLESWIDGLATFDREDSPNADIEAGR